MIDIQWPTAEIRRGKKKKKKEEERLIEITGQNIMSASATQGGHKKLPAIILYPRNPRAT